MLRRLAFPFLKWAVGLALLGGLLALAYGVHTRTRERQVAGATGDTVQVSKRVVNNAIKLGKQLAESHGIRDAAAEAVAWQARVIVYGRVVPNPRTTAEVRAPFAGTLRAVRDGAWPAPGSRVRAGQVLGWLDIRVGPQDRLDLLAKLNEARAKQRGAEESVKIHQERVERFAAAGAGVSRGELDTVQTQLADARTQLAVAKAVVKEWQSALAALDEQGERKASTWSRPLSAPASGEVTDLTGRPGTAVEAGALVARLIDFRFALVRLDVPTSAVPAGAPAQIELFPIPPVPPAYEGATNRPEPEPPPQGVPAALVGPAPQIEMASQLAGYWYEVDTAAKLPGLRGAVWRPGLFVNAYLSAPGAAPRSAVAVPATALLYHQGRALVYVCIAPGKFERREVQVLGRDAGRWVLAVGVAADERVVTRGAQVLLSEEFRGEADND